MLLLVAGAETAQGNSPAEQPRTRPSREQPPGETAGDIDFARDIEPLLKRHCGRCHSDERKLGGLSLASREQAVKGGQSGQNVLAPGDRNELLRRLHVDNPEERMPLEGPALSAAQIDLFARWIDAGAPWPQAAPSPREIPRPETSTLLESIGAWLDLWDRWHLERLRPAGYALVALLLALLVVERLKRRYAVAGAQPAGLAARIARLPRLAYAVGLCGIALYGLATYTWGLLGDLAISENTLQQVQTELQKSPGRGTATFSFDHNEIYWPLHPPRLGGTYYRGNDERNPALFNGGVYRTATFTLELRDSGDRVLKVGDPVDGPLTVRLELRKAPNATRLLFSDSTMGPVCLSFVPPQPEPEQAEDATARPAPAESAKPAPAASAKPAAADQAREEDFVPGPTTGGPYKLQVIEPETCWELRAPLPPLPAGKPLRGMIYLYPLLKERPDDDAQQPHYAIAYRLQQDDDGRLTSNSTLHLGSMYHTSTVLEIPEGRIAPTDWFDYRPLPEIEGGNTSDPKLLGIESHAGERGP